MPSTMPRGNLEPASAFTRKNVIVGLLPGHALLQEGVYKARHHDSSCFVVLSLSGFQSNGARSQINLPNAKVEQLAHAPTKVVRNFEHRPQPRPLRRTCFG